MSATSQCSATVSGASIFPNRRVEAPIHIQRETPARSDRRDVLGELLPMAKDPQRIRQALFAAIAAVIPDILDCPADVAPFYRVTAEGRSGFAAIPELRRRFPGTFPGSRWNQVSEMVRQAFMAEAPDHVNNLVGTATGGAVRLHAEDWVRYGVTAVLGATDFNLPTETEITAVVDHLVAFVRSPRVALRFLAG